MASAEPLPARYPRNSRRYLIVCAASPPRQNYHHKRFDLDGYLLYSAPMKRRSRTYERSLAGGVGYRVCARLYRAAVRSVDPRAATLRALQRQGDRLVVAGKTFDL